MPTSMLVAYQAFCIGNPRRNFRDRDASCSALRALLSRLCAENALVLHNRRLGDERLVEIQVGSDGSVQAQQLWTSQCFRTCIAPMWRKDQQDSRKPWITSIIGMESRVLLGEVFPFLLDPRPGTRLAHDESPLGKMFAANILNLLSQVALYLNSLASSLTVGRLPENYTRKRAHTLTWQCKRVIAEMCWSQEDSGTRALERSVCSYLTVSEKEWFNPSQSKGPPNTTPLQESGLINGLLSILSDILGQKTVNMALFLGAWHWGATWFWTVLLHFIFSTLSFSC